MTTCEQQGHVDRRRRPYTNPNSLGNLRNSQNGKAAGHGKDRWRGRIPCPDRAHPAVKALVGLLNQREIAVRDFVKVHKGVRSERIFKFWRYVGSPIHPEFDRAVRALGYEVVIQPVEGGKKPTEPMMEKPMSDETKAARDLDALCRMPGAEGAMWRLVKAMDPNLVRDWIHAETALGTHPHHTARALGSVLAAICFGYGTETTDLREAVVGPEGVVRHYQKALQAKVDRHRRGQTAAGVFVPTKEDADVFGG